MSSKPVEDLNGGVLVTPALADLFHIAQAAGAGVYNSRPTSIELLLNVIVALIVDVAPGTLNTLNELAAAIGDDPDFSATILAAIAAKQDGSANLDTFAGIAPSADVQSILAAANHAAIKVLLGLVIGTNVQAYSAKLAAIAANTVSTQAGTAYTAVLADADTFIRFTNGSPVTFTIPPNSAEAFPVGTEINFAQSGAGALTVAAGAGVTINSRSADLTLAGQYAAAFVKKTAADTWLMNGDL